MAGVDGAIFQSSRCMGASEPSVEGVYCVDEMGDSNKMGELIAIDEKSTGELRSVGNVGKSETI